MRPFPFAPVLHVPSCALAMSRSEFLWQLATQLASLATLEDAVAHGVQALREAPQEPVVPLPAARPAPRSALLQPRSRSRSPLFKAPPNEYILLRQRVPTALSVKSCPAAPPDRSLSSHRRSVSSHGVRPAAARSPEPSDPRAAAADPSASVARPARQKSASGAAKQGNAGGTSTADRCGDISNVQCGARFSVKSPRVVQCRLAVPTPRLTMTTTTLPCCSCLPTPSSRLLCLQTSLKWTSS